MGARPPQFTGTPVQLVLCGRRTDALVKSEVDWRELGLIVARMVFWCGGNIYGCRCEGNGIRFAMQVAHATLGAMAHHISGAFALHLRQTRGMHGAIFKHYSVIPLHDEYFLDDLVLWLHRPASGTRIWTADEAYLKPNSMPWIDTARVLSALSDYAGRTAYRRRKSEQISPQLVERFTRRPRRARGADRRDQRTPTVRPSIEAIAQLVAGICNVSYGDMLADTRKRSVSKARVIATVLSTRNGATAAAAARLFNRSRSALIEQVEHYRVTQPEVFAEAESMLEAFLAENRK
jgi:hypothetical protein